MGKRLRFHLDEHINPDIALGLCRHGIDVTTTVEAGLRTKSDKEQLSFALKREEMLHAKDDQTDKPDGK